MDTMYLDDDTLLDVKPQLSILFNKTTLSHTLSVDSGVEDLNRRRFAVIGVPESICLSISVNPPEYDEGSKRHLYAAEIVFKSNTSNESAVLAEHSAKYSIKSTSDGEPAAELEDVVEEINNGWNTALQYIKQTYFMPLNQEVHAAETQVQSMSQSHVQAQQSTNHPYTTDGGYMQTPISNQGYNAPQPQSPLKNLPTSWVVLGSSIITFILTLLAIFLLQGIVNSANAESSSTTKKAKFAETTTETVAAKTDGSKSLGINTQEFANVQAQTVQGMLKEMGIDPTHNQQDMGCLVE